MKRKFIYFVLVILPFIAGSCSDFLDREPDTILTEDQVFSDPNMIKAVLANYYGRLDWGQRTSDVNTYCCLDEAMRSSQGPDLFRTFGDDHWRVYDYGLIRNINQFLVGLKETTVITEDEKAQIGAEACFIRAYTYFCTCRCLGGMPIVGDAVFEYVPGMDVTAIQYPRATEAEMYDYIIAQCDSIASILPTAPSKNAARGTRGAALALKARAAIYAASIAKYNNLMVNPIKTEKEAVGIPANKANDYYKIAYDTAKKLIDEGVYVLQDNKPDRTMNFFNAVCEKENNQEVIWARDYKGPSNYVGFTRDNIPVSHAEDIPCSHLTPIVNLVEAFEYINDRNGKLKIEENGDYVYYDTPQKLFENKDPRLFATVITPGAVYRSKVVDIQTGVKHWENGQWVIETGTPGISFTSRGATLTAKNGPVMSGDAQYINKSGFFMRKFMDEVTGSATLGKGSEMWFPRFRMGEIYLIAAEAAMELGDQANARKYINAIRSRAGIQELTGNITLDDIVQERRVELAFENHRFYDLKRWRLADKVWNNDDNSEMAVPHVLFPFVIDEEGNPHDGKWVFDKQKTYMAPYPRYFQLKNYYNFLDQGWLNNNPKLEKNPYQS